MKTTIFRVLVSATLLFSCNKDGIDSKSNFFKVKIDTKLYEAKTSNAFATADSDEILIYGIFDDKRTFYISLDPSKEKGSHQLTERPNFAFYQNEVGVGFRSDFGQGGGEVTITEKTPDRISGTFKAVVSESPKSDAKKLTATEGEFSVPFRK